MKLPNTANISSFLPSSKALNLFLPTLLMTRSNFWLTRKIPLKQNNAAELIKTNDYKLPRCRILIRRSSCWLATQNGASRDVRAQRKLRAFKYLQLGSWRWIIHARSSSYLRQKFLWKTLAWKLFAALKEKLLSMEANCSWTCVVKSSCYQEWRSQVEIVPFPCFEPNSSQFRCKLRECLKHFWRFYRL